MLPNTIFNGILFPKKGVFPMVDNKFIEAYWKFRNREISSLREFGTYLGHCSYYHKCIYKFSEEYEGSPEYEKALKEQLKKNPNLRGTITDKSCFKEKSRGRKGIKGVTEQFKEVYWRYENYEISPKEACELTGYSKNWFHKTAVDYEKTVDYEKDLKKHKSVLKKPSRTMVVPEGFREDSTVLTDEELSKKYHICLLNVGRLKMKMDKKAVWKAIGDMKKNKK